MWSASVAAMVRPVRLSLQQLHDEEGLVGFRGVVVEDAHARGVSDLVRDVRLPEESLHHGAIARQLGVHDLQRGALPVAVRGGIHRRDPADAEQGVEAPLAADSRAHARGSDIFFLRAGGGGFSHG
jgi:hypothetical protein